MKKLIFLFIYLIVAPTLKGQQWDTINKRIEGDLVTLIKEINGKLLVSGAIAQVGQDSIQGTIIWDGYHWDSLAAEGLGALYDFTYFDDEFYFCGGFLKVNNIPQTRSIVKWDSTMWSTVGGGG